MPSIFLSHSHLDRDVAHQIYHLLMGEHIKVWVDEAEIKPGESIIAKIGSAIDEMEYLGVVLSPNSVMSTWVLKELRMALTDELESKRLRVIGLLVADCDMPGFLRDKKYIDCRRNLQNGVRELIDFLNGKSPIVAVPPQATFAEIIEEADDELWGRLTCGLGSSSGGEPNREATSELIRTLGKNQLEASLAVGVNWTADQYKHFLSWLVDDVQKYVQTDEQGAKRLIRDLLNLGILEEATDIDYHGREPAYTQGDILWVIKRVAQRSGLFARFAGLERYEV